MSKGIAMPHARPECGAKETSLSIITLKNPVEFGNEDFDPVTMVIGLSSVDSKSHLELLSDLSNIMDDEELIEKAKYCKTKSELIELINEVIPLVKSALGVGNSVFHSKQSSEGKTNLSVNSVTVFL